MRRTKAPASQERVASQGRTDVMRETGQFASRLHGRCRISLISVNGSMPGQLGDDRSERISGIGADNEVGEAAVLPPPQDLLGGRRRVAREYQERVRRA